MRDIDLFEQQKLVGNKILHLMEEKGITRTELCEQANISKPTLNKLLLGEMPNKVNYEKHLSKVCMYLEIDDDYFCEHVRQNHFEQIMNFYGYSIEDMSKMTGIALNRLQSILNGRHATIAEYRDIAVVLRTSTATIRGNEQFEVQLADLELFHMHQEEELKELGVFWKAMGILLNGREKYLWFPVTRFVLSQLADETTGDWVVLPCMGNKVLLLNREQVKEIIFVDEADDGPDGFNWYDIADEVKVPLVVYEAIGDYMITDLDDAPEDEASSKFKEYIRSMVEELVWDEDKMWEISQYSTIYFADGTSRTEDIDLVYSEELLDVINMLYDWRMELDEMFINYYDDQGSIFYLNPKNVALITMPLIRLEDALEKYREE